MGKNFSGGIHPPDYKLTQMAGIEPFGVSSPLYVPVNQHIGKPNVLLVKKGDTLKAGDVLARSEELFSSPVHSPVSGKILDIIPYPDNSVRKCECVVIEGEDDKIEVKKYQINSKEDLLKIIKDAGIIGMGGAGFPAHVKYMASVDTLIINGAECEPYLTCDYRLMLERGQDLLSGIEMIMRVMQISSACIGIEDNKTCAIKALSEINKNLNIKIKALKTKYPQGGEKQLIYSVLERTVPEGKLPKDVGVIVSNVATVLSIYDAANFGTPLTERVVTVSGNILHKKNLLVKIGTPISRVLEKCGYVDGEVVIGGPMTGYVADSLDLPVTKTTSGILVISPEVEEEKICIKCGRCVRACPMFLSPLMYYSNIDNSEVLNKLKINLCIECGCCSYECPAKIPLVQYIKLGKLKVRGL